MAKDDSMSPVSFGVQALFFNNFFFVWCQTIDDIYITGDTGNFE